MDRQLKTNEKSYKIGKLIFKNTREIAQYYEEKEYNVRKWISKRKTPDNDTIRLIIKAK